MLKMLKGVAARVRCMRGHRRTQVYTLYPKPSKAEAPEAWSHRLDEAQATTLTDLGRGSANGLVEI